MIDLQYHKGQKCVYGSTFCQEGFCSGCNIFQKLTPESMFSQTGSFRSVAVKESKYGFQKVGSLQAV
jgi:hypothetical protein